MILLPNIKIIPHLTISILCFVTTNTLAQDKSSLQTDIKWAESQLSKYSPTLEKTARKIWEYAELGYKETRSSSELQQLLRDNGFNVKSGIAGIPTAFVGEFGSGKPVVTLLAEFDALPGFSQDTFPFRKVKEGTSNGHACGHNLFGVGSVTAAIIIKDWLIRTNTAGTIRLLGTPAEEGGAAKVYLTREGFLDNTDVAVHWHPDNQNNASPSTTYSLISFKTRFYGVSSHAAGAPEKGKSALDAVEAMNFMVNLLREHLEDGHRIHYVITNGGKAPNVVPDLAEVYYYVRHENPDILRNTYQKIMRITEGAALGTGTTSETEIIHGEYNLLINEALAKLAHQVLLHAGGIKWNQRELKFAEQLYATLDHPADTLGVEAVVKPYVLGGKLGGSTDVGDISWQVPTVGFTTACWPASTPAHSWQAVACNGMSLGMKGTKKAVTVLSVLCFQLFRNPSTIAEAKKELVQKKGENYQYIPLLGDREPALNYRD